MQPLNNFSTQEAEYIKDSLSAFYKKNVIILPVDTIPRSFLQTEIDEYNADSIIQYLEKYKNDNIVEVIGLTYVPLYTIKYNSSIKDQYYDQYIFGLGYQPGNSCVVSDQKIQPKDINQYTTILKNLILHEVGHNMGLSHCDNSNCIMSEKNGSTFTLSRINANYCVKCWKKLNTKLP